jgi:protein SCO1/2
MNKINLIKNLSIILIFLVTMQNAFADSLYDLKTNWRDTENNKTDVSIAKGSYTIIAMVYTGCAHACPMTISKIKEIEKDFSKDKFTDLKIVLASFDVKNDRPAKLKKYQTERKLNPEQWKFLSSETEDDARKLAVTLGISYKDIGDGDFSHSNLITLLDPNGKILASINSLNADTQPLIDGLQESLKKETKK